MGGLKLTFRLGSKNTSKEREDSSPPSPKLYERARRGCCSACLRLRTLPDPSQLAAPEGRGDGYQHPLSGARARRQGAREGGDALECTCAELAHPQGARRQALFRRLSDPVRRDIVAAACAAAAASKGRRAQAH